LAAVAAGALLVASARALYDVIGIITVAHAHRHDDLARARAALPWDDRDDGWLPDPDGDDERDDALEPLAR
jgi:hypothetical protein